MSTLQTLIAGIDEKLLELLEKQGLTPRDGHDEASHQIFDEQKELFRTSLTSALHEYEKETAVEKHTKMSCYCEGMGCSWNVPLSSRAEKVENFMGKDRSNPLR